MCGHPVRSLVMAMAIIWGQEKTTVDAMVKESQKEMQAYDCSVPLGRERVFATAEEECDLLSPEVEKTVNRTYILLQRAQRTRVTVKRCTLKTSAVGAYCGMHSHSVLIPHLFYTGKAVDVTMLDCVAYWNGKDWSNTEPSSGHIWNVAPIQNGVVEMNWMQAGWAAHWGTGMTATCKGGTFSDWNGQNSDLTVGRFDQLELREEEAVVTKEGKMILTGRGMELPCMGAQGFCTTGEGTFIWTQPQKDCNLYRARQAPVQGRETTTTDGSTTFISSDGAMLRLIKKEALSECGAVVYATDYARLFLVEQKVAKLNFDQVIHPSEVSVVTYANQQDAFLFGEATSYFKRELKAVLQKDCESGSRRRSRAYARLASEHRSTMDGETVSLGEGYFATAGGRPGIGINAGPSQSRHWRT